MAAGVCRAAARNVHLSGDDLANNLSMALIGRLSSGRPPLPMKDSLGAVSTLGTCLGSKPQDSLDSRNQGVFLALQDAKRS